MEFVIIGRDGKPLSAFDGKVIVLMARAQPNTLISGSASSRWKMGQNPRACCHSAAVL